MRLKGLMETGCCAYYLNSYMQSFRSQLTPLTSVHIGDCVTRYVRWAVLCGEGMPTGVKGRIYATMNHTLD